MNEREALKLAIKTLRQIELASSATWCNTRWISNHAKDNAAKLEEALAQQEQEPVAWMQSDEEHISLWKDDYHIIPLYTTPPQRTWVGMTDEQIAEIAAQGHQRWVEFARAIEAKLKEKNK